MRNLIIFLVFFVIFINFISDSDEESKDSEISIEFESLLVEDDSEFEISSVEVEKMIVEIEKSRPKPISAVLPIDTDVPKTEIFFGDVEDGKKPPFPDMSFSLKRPEKIVEEAEENSFPVFYSSFPFSKEADDTVKEIGFSTTIKQFNFSIPADLQSKIDRCVYCDWYILCNGPYLTDPQNRWFSKKRLQECTEENDFCKPVCFEDNSKQKNDRRIVKDGDVLFAPLPTFFY